MTRSRQAHRPARFETPVRSRVAWPVKFWIGSAASLRGALASKRARRALAIRKSFGRLRAFSTRSDDHLPRNWLRFEKMALSPHPFLRNEPKSGSFPLPTLQCLQGEQGLHRLSPEPTLVASEPFDQFTIQV